MPKKTWNTPVSVLDPARAQYLSVAVKTRRAPILSDRHVRRMYFGLN